MIDESRKFIEMNKLTGFVESAFDHICDASIYVGVDNIERSCGYAIRHIEKLINISS